MSNGLHPDQVGLGPNCLQRLSTDHKSHGWQANSYYTPRKLCLWWVYCFHVVRAYVRASVRNVLFSYYLEESLLDFHQTLQTCSYMQDN